ncbi:MAG: TIGR03960 family B12-binding radical SAM protein [Planctomycetota bacterium]
MSQTLWPQIEPILLQARAPSQYIGGEFNSIVKEHASVDIKIALAFPDTYDIGMSHWGLQVLYGVINSRPDALAERVFAPRIDMEQLMRERGIPLFSLESHIAVKDFDVVGFSLQYELAYTNILNMLDLAGIPLESSLRNETHPLIIAGGPAAFNPEPLADFIDIFVIGDGEEKIVEIIEVLKIFKKGNVTGAEIRKEKIKHLVEKISSLYVPSLYQMTYKSDQTLKEIKPLFVGTPIKVLKATIKNLDEAFYPVSPVVPFGDVVHSRINLEIMRGCPHSCRFCISSVIKSPLRYRSVEKLMSLAETIYGNTGYDEISLLSLSSGDHPDIDELILRLTNRFKSKRVGLSLPSLRIDERLMKLPGVLNEVRKAGFTMAPEAGTENLRNIINKDIKDEDLYKGIRAAYQNGWRLVKLYFMIGLPGETMADIKAIAEIIHKASKIGLEFHNQPGNINVTISPFVPKPHTPFQWAEMNSIDELRKKQSLLRGLLRSRYIKVKMHFPERSFVESVFSRGDRRLGRLLMMAHKNGCKFDAWDEFFDFNKWVKSFEQTRHETGLEWFNPDFYAIRKREFSEILPWDIIDCGIAKKHFIKDALDSKSCISINRPANSSRVDGCENQLIDS